MTHSRKPDNAGSDFPALRARLTIHFSERPALGGLAASAWEGLVGYQDPMNVDLLATADLQRMIFHPPNASDFVIVNAGPHGVNFGRFPRVEVRGTGRSIR